MISQKLQQMASFQIVVTFLLVLSSRTPWKRCCFSGDGEYIVAGSARQHALYIWEKSIGNLVKILHGTRGELLLDVAVRMSDQIFSLRLMQFTIREFTSSTLTSV